MTLYNFLCCWSGIRSHEVLFHFHQDIMISGAPNPAETTNAVKRTNENHLSNQLRYSLRVSIYHTANHLPPMLMKNCWISVLQVYASVLYLQLPGYFKIILRGQEVQRHSIATDLIYRQAVSYTPLEFLRKKEVCLEIHHYFSKFHVFLPHCPFIYYNHVNMELLNLFNVPFCIHMFTLLIFASTCLIQGEVVTSIGFLNGAPTISVHGFNIYHRNRLILVSLKFSPCLLCFKMVNGHINIKTSST